MNKLKKLFCIIICLTVVMSVFIVSNATVYYFSANQTDKYLSSATRSYGNHNYYMALTSVDYGVVPPNTFVYNGSITVNLIQDSINTTRATNTFSSLRSVSGQTYFNSVSGDNIDVRASNNVGYSVYAGIDYWY